MYIFFLGFIFITVGIWFYCRGCKIEKQKLEEIENKYREQIKKDIKEEQNKLFQIQKDIIQADEKRQNAIQRATEAQNVTQQLLLSEQKRLAAEISKQKEINLLQLKEDYQKKLNELNSLYCSKEQTLKQDYEKHRLLLESDILSIQEKLDDFRARQEAINEAIRKEEELQNEVDMHRILLTNNNKEDISYLISIEQNIHNKELLYKLIWSEYIQKSFNQMIKNIFGSRNPKNVIYCIENINTHKKYIGKTSAEVTKRWADHLKNSLNIGGIKRQPIHDALFGHWDEFTFRVIEEVKDEKLSEKEKYYIGFFQTDKYGYNVKSGG